MRLNKLNDATRVGVVGYSSQKFDENKARNLLLSVFDDLADQNIEVVSGLTAMGVPLIAYQEAQKRGHKTTGIACQY